MFSLPIYFFGTALVALALLIVKIGKIGSRRADLPPGPPTLPLIGNLHLVRLSSEDSVKNI